MAAMSTMHKQVDNWTEQENHVRQDAEQVRPMLFPKEEAGDGQKTQAPSQYGIRPL